MAFPGQSDSGFGTFEIVIPALQNIDQHRGTIPLATYLVCKAGGAVIGQRGLAAWLLLEREVIGCGYSCHHVLLWAL